MCRIVHFHTIYAEPKASDSARSSQSERVIGLLAGRAATECHESRCPLRTPLDEVSLVPHTGTACPSGTCREARLESNRRNSVSEKAKCRRDGSGCPLSFAPRSRALAKYISRLINAFQQPPALPLHPPCLAGCG